MSVLKKKIHSIPDQPKKIAVVGLMNAGKTCLLKTLFHEFDELPSLSPTRRVERSMTEFLQHPLSIWDFGGQDKYTRQYLKKPEQYLKKIAQLFYVIDCQDTEKLEKNFDYFSRLITILKECCPKSHVTILYNKIDPDLPNYSTVMGNKQSFKEKAMNILSNNGYGYQGYKTSKYIPLWIVKAFSKSMLDNPQVFDETSRILKNFSNTNNLDAALVFTKQGFSLGFHFSDKFKFIDIQELFIKFFTKFEQIYKLMPIIDVEFKGIKIYSMRFFLLPESSKLPIYFGFIYRDNHPSDDIIKNFTEQIKENLKLITAN